MKNNYKKTLGCVYSFDGEAGIIVSDSTIYNFNKKDLLDKDIEKGNFVEFVSNTNIFGNEKDLVALCINKYDNIDLSKYSSNIKKKAFFK